MLAAGVSPRSSGKNKRSAERRHSCDTVSLGRRVSRWFSTSSRGPYSARDTYPGLFQQSTGLAISLIRQQALRDCRRPSSKAPFFSLGENFKLRRICFPCHLDGLCTGGAVAPDVSTQSLLSAVPGKARPILSSSGPGSDRAALQCGVNAISLSF